MPEIDYYFPAFKEIDKNVKHVGNYRGEFGIICRIWYNDLDDIYYYAADLKQWYHTFGSRNKDKVPREDWNQEGVSVPINEVRQAIGHNKAYIVIHKSPENIFYACDAKDWYAYATKYGTIYLKNKSKIDGTLEAGVPRRLLFDMQLPKPPAQPVQTQEISLDNFTQKV